MYKPTDFALLLCYWQRGGVGEPFFDTWSEQAVVGLVSCQCHGGAGTLSCCMAGRQSARAEAQCHSKHVGDRWIRGVDLEDDSYR